MYVFRPEPLDVQSVETCQNRSRGVGVKERPVRLPRRVAVDGDKA